VFNSVADRTTILWKNDDNNEVRHYRLCYFLWVTTEFSFSSVDGFRQKFVQRLKEGFPDFKNKKKGRRGM